VDFLFLLNCFIEPKKSFKLGRHICLPQMRGVILHAQISCLITGCWCDFDHRELETLQFIHFQCGRTLPESNAIFTVGPSFRSNVVDGVYLGSFMRRIQRAWRGYMVRRRRMALCMASNPRLGAGSSPLLGAVIRVLCVEDLVRIV
jgi:hypothetical protein